jgi:hypothetical protein
MTVGELRKKLEGIDPQTKVVVQWEIDCELTYFDVSDVSLRRGAPSRVNEIVGFTVGGYGSAAWLFIDVAEARLPFYAVQVLDTVDSRCVALSFNVSSRRRFLRVSGFSTGCSL